MEPLEQMQELCDLIMKVAALMHATNSALGEEAKTLAKVRALVMSPRAVGDTEDVMAEIATLVRP